MDKKETKRRRTRQIFAETAARMIQDGGVESVSVRKVTEEAGYSLGTLYNHFSNLDELFWITRELLIGEVAKYMIDWKKPMRTADDLSDSLKLYVRYFTEHKNVFRFFYFHQLDKSAKPEMEQAKRTENSAEMAETCRLIEELSGCDAGQSPLIYKTFIYALHGLLMLSLSGNDNLAEEQLPGEIDTIVKLMLRQGG